MPRLGDGKTFLPKFSFGKKTNENAQNWLFENKHYYYFLNLKSVPRLVNLKVVCRPCIQDYTRFVWTLHYMNVFFFLNRTVLYIGFMEKARAANRRINLSGLSNRRQWGSSPLPGLWKSTPSLIQHVCFVFHKTLRSYIEIWKSCSLYSIARIAGTYERPSLSSM
jgi:hypothetical protein